MNKHLWLSKEGIELDCNLKNIWAIFSIFPFQSWGKEITNYRLWFLLLPESNLISLFSCSGA